MDFSYGPAPQAIRTSRDSTSSVRPDKEKQAAQIRHMQQRLILMHHAQNCNHERGRCPITPHCAVGKGLWAHMSTCKETQNCTYPHCISTKFVLSHHRQCRNAACITCGPVRQEVSRKRKLSQQHVSREHRTSASIVASDKKHNQQTPALHDSPVESRSSAASIKLPHNAIVLNRSLTETCLEILNGLQTHQHGWVFSTPVDPVELDVPDYHEIIKNPLDLGTVRYKLTNGLYRNLQDYEADVTLTFKNALTYNTEGSVVHGMAVELLKKFKQDYGKALSSLHIDTSSLSQPAPKKQKTAKGSKGRYTKSFEHGQSLASSRYSGANPSSGNDGDVMDALAKSKCLRILKGLLSHQHGWVFQTPVDPVELDLPDYYVIIKKPMDLGTVHKKLIGDNYRTMQDFASDVTLTFDNAMIYNGVGTVVYEMAEEVKGQFKQDYQKAIRTGGK